MVGRFPALFEALFLNKKSREGFYAAKYTISITIPKMALFL
jgi:hypothetical protein